MRNNRRCPEYDVWSAMKSRCLNPNYSSFADVGGRGICFDKGWCNFKTFLADMGKRPAPDMMLTRLDPDGDFTPANCSWEPCGVAQHHSKLRKNNTTGIKGVCQHRKSFQAAIYVDAMKIYLGTYPTIEEAAGVRLKAEETYW